MEDGFTFSIAYDEAEFISADAARHVLGTCMRFENGGESLDGLISRSVAVGIVDQLEFV